jgi:hypothetical protein
VRTPRALRILDASGRPLRTIRTRTTAVAFAPHTHLLALARPAAGPDQSEVVLIAAEPRPAAPRPLFVGAGALTDLAWSPDGRWLLVGWPSADQWVFVRAQSGRRVVAVSNVGRQFNPGAPGNQPFPSVSGWCCTAAGPPG